MYHHHHDLVVCLMTGPKPLPKRALHIVQPRASSSKLACPLLSLRSSSSFLRLLPHLPFTSIPPFIFPSVTRCRRQFLHKMWQVQLAFRLLISCRIFVCSLTLSNTSSCLTWSVLRKKKLLFIVDAFYTPYLLRIRGITFPAIRIRESVLKHSETVRWHFSELV